MAAKNLLTWRVPSFRMCWRCGAQLPETQCVGRTMLGWLCKRCDEANVSVCCVCGVRLQPWGLKGGNFGGVSSKRAWCKACMNSRQIGGEQ